MAAKSVPEKDLQAVSKAFLGMSKDPEGQKILVDAAQLVKLPSSTGFVVSSGAEYTAYRNFYQTAPANLR
jgi:phosphonate transport system substrate-binding protein